MKASLRFVTPWFALASSAGTAFAQPSFRGLGFLPGYETSYAYAVSADGVFVAGYCYDNDTSASRAFRWSAFTGLRDLGKLFGADYSVSHGVSAHGYLVVGESLSQYGYEGFRWQGGEMAGVGDLAGGTFASYANGVSADASITVGTSNADVGNGDRATAFRKVRSGSLVSLGYLPGGVYSDAEGVSADGSVIVGQSNSGAGDQAFRWTAGGGMIGLGGLPGMDANSDSHAVSADGSVVVGQGYTGPGVQAFRWTKAGGMTGLGELPGGGSFSAARAVSADGSVVVGQSDGGTDVAFIWDAQNGMRNLRDVLVALGVQGLSGWTLVDATGVSPDGLTIVGIGTDPDNVTEAWVATLGEPCTQVTERASVTPTGGQANGGSTFGSVSNDGNLIAFSSAATNIGGDTNGKSDIFVRNRSSGWTSRVSISTTNAQANGDSLNPCITGNGRFVVFESDATNLVGNDTNGQRDIFIRDRTLGTTARVSVSSAGAQGNGSSTHARASSDGRFVVFQSIATNLVAGDTNGVTDIFVRDRQSNATTRVSLDSDGFQVDDASYDASISDSGLAVVFASDATNLVPNDSNGATDIFLRNRSANATGRVSIGTYGAQGNQPSFRGCVSGNGRYIAFTSSASNLVYGDTNGADDIFLRDRNNATTTRVSVTTSGDQANANCSVAAISADGRYLLYNSFASNLVANDTNGMRDAFLHDNWTFLTQRVSRGQYGQQATANCAATSISASGRFAVFNTIAGNLVQGDTGYSDVFLRDLCKPQ